MKKGWVVSALVICLSCSGDDKPAPPENLIAPEKMISILVDLQILETHFQRLHQQPYRYQKSLDSSSYYIFQKYEVTKADFDTSYGYYAQDANTLYGIYEAALDTINFRLSQSGRGE